MKWGWLKTAGKVALDVAGAAIAVQFPPAAPLLNMVVAGVTAAEQRADLTGPQKKQTVLDLIESKGPEILQSLTGSGRVIADPDRFQQGADLLIEAVNHLIKSTAPAAAGPVGITQVVPLSNGYEMVIVDGMVKALRKNGVEVK